MMNVVVWFFVIIISLNVWLDVGWKIIIGVDDDVFIIVMMSLLNVMMNVCDDCIS